MDFNRALGAFQVARRLGCRSMHIGGGEPFLRFEALMHCCEAAKEAGVTIEYIETNSSWYRGLEEAADMLRQLKHAGVTTLLVSISPFHNEFIPFDRVQGVMEACRVSGLRVMPWIREFVSECSALDTSKPHGMKEYEEAFGSGYLNSIPGRYWTIYRGRALYTYSHLLHPIDLKEICDNSQQGCRELSDTSHFHMDLYGNYIPGLCSGLAIELKDLGNPLSPEKYPLICRLYEHGPGALLDLAKDFGFKAKPAYVSKCHLCQEIRAFLVHKAKEKFLELSPHWFYRDIPI